MFDLRIVNPAKGKPRGKRCRVKSAYAETESQTWITYEMGCGGVFRRDGEFPPEACPCCQRKLVW
jgi:hypothetical protein